MTPQHHTDLNIIDRIKRGSVKDQHEVAQHLLKSFRGIVHSIVVKPGLGSHEDLQDILNDAVTDLILYVRSDKFEPSETKLSTFFYAIAKNKWLNVIRQRSREPHFIDIPEALQSKSYRPILDDLISSEEKKEVKVALERLDQSCFNLLYKYWIQDMKLKDIAAELDVSEEVVKKRHERCRKKLRIYLKRDPRK